MERAWLFAPRRNRGCHQTRSLEARAYGEEDMKCDACGRDDMFMVCRECAAETAAETHTVERLLTAERARSAALQAALGVVERALHNRGAWAEALRQRVKDALSQPAPTEEKKWGVW